MFRNSVTGYETPKLREFRGLSPNYTGRLI